MPNYANGKIYKIWSPSHLDEIYIGSTCTPLSHRMAKHRYELKKHLKTNENCHKKTKGTTSFKILEYGDARIELIEKVNCKCKEELIKREGYYIRTLDCVNKIIPDRTYKEYYKDNKDKIKLYKQGWYKENRDLTIQRAKDSYRRNKERRAMSKSE